MWNAKRILLLVAGFVLFFGVYLVYARFFGGLDGLPALPQAYWPGPLDGTMIVLPQRQNNADRQLKLAFGSDCAETKWSIRLEVSAHNLVIAAQDFTLDNGRVKLWPFSVAIRGKEKDSAAHPEINTVRADVAYLSFDKPVTNIMEIGSRRIIGCELGSDPKKGRGVPGEAGGVTIVNNRGTPQRDDDISIFTPGPIYYQENLNRGWTENVVLLTDMQSKPKPTTINAVGMDVFLTPENKTPPPGKPAAGKGKAVGNVDRIVLRSDVNMHLWIDGKSGFMAGGGPKAKPVEAKQPALPAERVQLVITTQGPFSYDLRANRATFDIAPKPGLLPNQVVLHRINNAEGKREQLVCEYLELLFDRENPKDAAPAKGAAQQDDMKIKSARALTKTPTGQVTITSDSENLNAFGTELVYDSQARLTTLKGSPDMVAIKDGNKIHAPELRIKMDDKTFTEVTAPGPGRIELLDKEKGQRHMHARWQDQLVAVREGVVDVLLLTGQATFEDKEQGQRIQADRLKVWLEPAPASAPPPGKPPVKATNDAEAPRRRPQRIEARGHVVAVSPDLHVRETELLVIRFVDAAPLHGPPLPPSATPAKPPGPGSFASNPVSQEAPPPTLIPSAPPVVGKPAPEKPKPKNPLEVSAQSMEATVLRSDVKNELEKLICRGAVRVEQKPATKDDKEIDIKGDTLELTRHPEGSKLLVIGKTAVVKFDQVTILGPVVTIDQRINEATVDGGGAMTMPSDTTFDGGRLEKTTMMTVYWDKEMFFDGKFAEFQGGVQASQELSRMACQTMQVFFDREVSFRENQKTNEKPKVHKLVCVNDVRIEEKSLDKTQKLLSHRKLSARELALDNVDRRVFASGAGVVRILQWGSSGEVIPAPGSKPRPGAAPKPQPGKDEQELKLTRVTYRGRMYGDEVRRTVTFYEEVEVIHVPATDIDMKIDMNKLPPGSMFLQCEVLKVKSPRTENGQGGQELEAHKRVIVQADEFWGKADVITFNEDKDQLTLSAAEGNYASLHRAKVQGGPFEEIKGKQIIYYRRTNDYKVIGGVGVRTSN